MQAPDELYKLDLILFASASGMKLEHMAHDWMASISIENKTLIGYGTRPWMATAALHRKVIDRHYEAKSP